MMELTKERLQEIAEDGFLKHGEAKAMARQILASMEQEPVGEVVLGDYDDCGDYPDAKVVCIAAQGQADWNNFRNGTKLYAAPQLPQPAVPECYQRLLHHAYGMTMGQDWNKGTMAGHHRGKLCKAVEECRAAMLQGKADGNSPVIPDGYVLVPKEITCAMDDAAWEAYHETRCMSDIWAALLAAAAPQQEVKSALEHGMQRYAGAMQKLADAGD